MNVIEILKELVACPSVTPDEAGTFEFVRGYLEEFEAEEIEKEGIKNLYLVRKNGEGPHLCFAGHLDVVPPGDGWTEEPFKPVEKNGYLYGRGTQDMKAGVAAFIKAAKESDFAGTLSVLLTADEEGDAVYGTQEVLKVLQARNALPDMAVVAEPTCTSRFGDAMKVGRRGSINGVLKVFGKGGHAAYPEKALNPIDLIGRILPSLTGKELDGGDDRFAPSRLVVTDIRAGREVTNLTPGELKLMFNVRNSTNTTAEKVEAYVRKLLDQAEIREYDLSVKQSSYPFLTKSGPYSQRLVGALERAIQEVTGVTPEHSTGGGTSDARYIAAFGVDVVEFGPVNDRIHGPDERVEVEEVLRLEAVFRKLITSLSEGK